MQEGDDHIERVSNDDDHLVAVKHWCIGHDPWGVSLNNPYSVVHDVLPFETLQLQVHVHVESIVATSLDTCEQFAVLAQESVA